LAAGIVAWRPGEIEEGKYSGESQEKRAMSFRQKLREEIKAVALATLYFGSWIAVLMVLKKVILEEYQIEFYGLSLAVVGTLVLAKVVLLLEHVPLGAWTRTRPVWVNVVLRTFLYALGVGVALILGKAILTT
jgi:hypothetical protein